MWKEIVALSKCQGPLREAYDEAIILPGLPAVKGSTKELYSADRLLMPPGSPCFD